MFLKHFFSQDTDFFVTEFGHSELKSSKTVGPWSREIYILHFVVKGYCDFSGFRVEEGQAFFISKRLVHSFTVSDNYEHYWIGFSGNCIKYIFEKFNLKITPHQLFYVENPDFAETLFSEAKSKFSQDDIATPHSIALSVLMAMLPMLKEKLASANKSREKYAEQVQNLILTNYAHPIKMSELAKEIHVTEKHMYRLFVNRFGISPQKFLLKTRMETAKKLLTETDLTIKEVSNSVGYTSLPSFSKSFSNWFKTTPGSVHKKTQR